MNRGTTRLYTAWVPLGDVDFNLGGLMILGKSNRLEELKQAYLNKDVDAFCENEADAALFRTGEKWWNGTLSDDPTALQRQLGLPWLTSEYTAGDLLVLNPDHPLLAGQSLRSNSDLVGLALSTRLRTHRRALDRR